MKHNSLKSAVLERDTLNCINVVREEFVKQLAFVPSFINKIFLVCLVAGNLFISNGFAQSESPAPATGVNAPMDLNQAFQREYVYLASQKQALLTLQKQTEQTLRGQSRELKAQANSLQSQLVAASTKNDEQHEYLMSLEKRKKELEKKGSSLENSYKKSQTMIRDMEAGLKFEISKEKETITAPDDLKISSFEEAFNKTNELISSSARTHSAPGSFLDKDDKLVEGVITRFGRSAAIGSIGDAHFVLAPNGSGLLKSLAASENPQGAFAHMFVFDNLSREAKIKHQAGITERLADFSPIIFLALILFLVAGLFTALIKV